MKDFLLMANINAITYKEFFPLLKEGKANAGYVFNKTLDFETPEGQTKKQTGICWYTTFPVIHKHLVLTQPYNPEKHKSYDNYDAINVDKVKDIPYDYEGTMGVPITIFGFDLDNVEIVRFRKGDDGKDLCIGGKDKYFMVLLKKNFEIADARDYTDNVLLKNKGTQLVKDADGKVAGRTVYPRVLIRKKQL